jgi:mannose-1-phosphate guanylyltransferase
VLTHASYYSGTHTAKEKILLSGTLAMTRSSGSRGHHGRIQPHERDTNDSVAIIGEGIHVTQEHSESVLTTLSHDCVVMTRQNYRNCIEEMCTFL